VAFSEIEPFPCSVLAHHYPTVPNLGDMTKFKDWKLDAIDLLVGGTPCQSFSVAGLRKGLDDPRGNLMLTYLAIADRHRPKWLVWENVPGVLSSNGGKDFGTFLGGLAELGYGFAYRVLDAQHFGVPQRRRRMFVVGCLGDWRSAAAVLFERHSVSGNPAPSRQTRKDVASTLSARTKGGGGLGTDFDLDGGLIAHTLRGEGFDASEDGTGRGTPLTVVGTMCMATGQAGAEIGAEISPTLNCNHEAPIAFSAKDHGADATKDLSPTLRAGAFDKSHANSGNWMAIQRAMQVRRLLPAECEKLQGFEPGYTNIPYRRKPAADGPRYKALGNSMAVPCMAWIGQRIQMVEDLAQLEIAA